ncbi:MAG: S-layer homology domain-containing protein, partial [Acidimicrobiia bacterium]|nr:S-layer homology domain-containing protein [Acidimicrobiia bacterium]
MAVARRVLTVIGRRRLIVVRCAVVGLWLGAVAGAGIAIPAVAQELAPGGTFVDDDGSIHEGAIEAIRAAGISSGCAPDRFCPDRLLTRGEMAAFLTRALELPPVTADHFVDDSNHLFEAEINAIAGAGVTLGCGPESFCPNDTMSRGQMASFLARAFDVAASDTNPFV